jgi:TonB-dependent SusC/RagA subfamily outer membrane receptor
MQFFNISHPVIKSLFMRKLSFTLAVIVVLSNHVMSQPWDRQMQVKKMDIRVMTDAFTANTFIEMEFYNPTNTEMEGLYSFDLDPGQAITAFQLDLSGQFRDGSIEEKWKARNAYNTIVGKRVDPALLQMDSYNHYSLRIYPVPANGSRRITMTIRQLLIIRGEKAVYKLPLNIKDGIGQLDVQLKIAGSTGWPSVIKGLLTDQLFYQKNNSYTLSLTAKEHKADQSLSFSIPLSLKQPSLCIKTINEQTFFALRLINGVNPEYDIHPSKIVVFWDVSATGRNRNSTKEIAFLKQYVAAHKISQLTIITFNQRIQDTAIFYTGANLNNRWPEYIRAFTYEGATQLGAMDFSTVDADAILVFSDGRNSYGKSLPVPGKIHVYCINSAVYTDSASIESIIARSGGRFIDLYEKETGEAVAEAGKTVNILMGLKAGDVLLDLNEKLSNIKKDTMLLSGLIPAGSQQVTLLYGNNGNVQEEEIIRIAGNISCDESPVERINMLAVFDQYAKGNNYWFNVLDWAKQEKVVTQSTSFIVLEKIEDYIRFNIRPPKDLEAKCDMNIFVRADEQRRKQFRKANEFEVLSSVANAYNERIKLWDKDQPAILLTEKKGGVFVKDENKTTQPEKVKTGASSSLVITEAMKGAEQDKVLSEVVIVTALGQTRQAKELGYSVSRVSATELTRAMPVNLQNGLTGKVSGLNVQSTNNGVFGDTRITLRGIRSLTGNNQPMLILDGVPIGLSYLSSINPADILNVTILKGASSTAIYGPDGVNGALVVTTKKGSRNSYSYFWSSYRLKDRADVDYLQEIKSVAKGDLTKTYNELRKTNGFEAGFYFDMALHFYKKDFKKEAMDILFSAADISQGDRQVQLAMGYILEAWKEFDEAIRVYKNLLLDHGTDIIVYRNLALAYYQKGNYQEAADTYYKGICLVADNYEYLHPDTKAMMLQEMNAVIGAHTGSIDVSGINQQLIKPLDYDLRVTLDCNNQSLNNSVSIAEPGGKICRNNKPGKSDGRLSPNYQSYYGNIAPEEYQVKNAKPGNYKIRVKYADYGYYYNIKVPSVIRIISFKKTGSSNETLEVENVMMDNQYGEVEIGEVKW